MSRFKVMMLLSRSAKARSPFCTCRLNHGLVLARHNSDRAVERCKEFEQRVGRRPRVLNALLGEENFATYGYKFIAKAFCNLGFVVDVAPFNTLQTPVHVAQYAVDNDVHAVGVRIPETRYNVMIPELIEELRRHGRSDIPVVCGGAIPSHDYQKLYDSGVAEVFGPGIKLPVVANNILDLIEQSQEDEFQ